MIIGESMPIEKHVGDELIGATINKNGILKMRADKVGKDTALRGGKIMKIITLDVQGMSCDHCVKAVNGALTDLEGVSKVDVNLETGKVDVEFDDSKVNLDQMKEAVEDQGYDVA